MNTLAHTTTLVLHVHVSGKRPAWIDHLVLTEVFDGDLPNLIKVRDPSLTRLHRALQY